MFLSIFAPKTVKNVQHCKIQGFAIQYRFGSKKALKNEFVDAKFLRAENMDLKLSKSGLRMFLGRLVHFLEKIKVW